MKRMKRLVALLVTIATLASLCVFSIPVSAAELPKVEVTADDELRIEKLEAFGVIDVKYDAASYVTRRQMAEIIAKYMNLTITTSEAETPFRDVKTSDSAYAEIRTLYDMGIISGDYDKKFNPDNYVSYDEALVFIINAIGYKMFAVREGGYPTGYHRVAISHGMLKNLSMKLGSDPVSIPDVYKMLEAALGSAAIEEEYYGSGEVRYTFSDTETFLSETYGIRKYRGYISGNEYTRLSNPVANLTDEQIEITSEQGTKVYETPGYIYGYMLGRAVDYYLKDDSGEGYELTYIEEAKKLNKTIKIDVDDLLPEQTTSTRIYYKDADNDEQHITFTAVRDFIYNNQSWHPGSLANALPERGYIEALDNNADGEYDVLFIYEYENAYVEFVDKYDYFIDYVGFGDLEDGRIDLTVRNNKYLICLAGSTEAKDINSVTAGSVISILESKNTTNKVTTIYVSNKTVQGTITAYDSDEGYLIGEEYYKAYDGCSFDLGDEGIFYLDMNNQLVKSKYNAANDRAVYGIMTAVGQGETRNDPEITVKIFTQSGDFLTAPLAERVKLDDQYYDMDDKDEVEDAMIWLTGSASDDAAITAVYPVKYTDVNGKIATLVKPADAVSDRDRESGDGVFRTIKENIVTIFKRQNNIVATWTQDEYNNGGAELGPFYTMPDFNVYDASSVLFVVPPDGEDFSDETKYQVKAGGFSEEKTVLEIDEIAAGNCYNSYSFGTADTHRIDLMVLKSAPASQPVSENTFGVIKKITDTVDEDGEHFKKFYINETTELLVEDQVKMVVPVYRNEDWLTTHKIQYQDPASINDILSNPESNLGIGSAIIYGLNAKGRIESIRVVAKYENGELKTFFRSEDSAYKVSSLNGKLFETNRGSESGEGGGGWENIIAGTIEAVNETPGMLTCKFLNEENADDEFLIATNPSGVYSYYDEEAQTIEHLTLGRFAKGDKFLVYVDQFYLLKTIIVFR